MENCDKENIQKKEDVEQSTEQKDLSASEGNLREGEKKMIKPFATKDMPGFEKIERREGWVKPFTTMYTPVAGNIKEETNPGILEKNESAMEEFDVQDVKIQEECQKNPCGIEGGIQPQINNFVDTNMTSDYDYPGGIVDMRSSEIQKNEVRDPQNSGEEKRVEHRAENEKSPQEIREKNSAMLYVRPIEQVSQETVHIVEKFWGNIENCPGLEPFLARAFEDYKRVGGNLANITFVKKDTEKEKGLNFTLDLVRCINNIYDTENGEAVIREYLVKISVFTKIGGKKEYCAQIETDKIKDSNWLKKATDSMATDPIAMGKKIAISNYGSNVHRKGRHCSARNHIPKCRVA